MTPRTFLIVSMLALLAATGSAAWGQSWSAAALLNEPSEAGSDVKTVRIVAARTGGFHAIYHVNDKIRYRRYLNGVLSAPVNVFPGTNFMANGWLAEAMNGDLHVVFEDWASDKPVERWYRSTNGGASWPQTLLLCPADANAKHPHIAPFGPDGSASMITSYFRSNAPEGNKQLYWSAYDGTAWTPDARVNSTASSEYEVFGMARSPVDGSVYRSFTDNGTLKMRRFNGKWWEPEIILDNQVSGSDTMHNRQRLAVNSGGQVMVLWDQNNRTWSVLYAPAQPPLVRTMVTDRGSWGNSLCAVPGTNRFFTVYAVNNATQEVGRTWTGSGWSAEEILPVPNNFNEFQVGPDLAAAADGTIYCGWEYWGSGKPQQYYAIRSPAPWGAVGTMSGRVVDQFGAPVAGVGIFTTGRGAGATGADGTYTFTETVGQWWTSAMKAHYSGMSYNATIVQGQTTTSDYWIMGHPPANVVNFTAVPGNAENTLQWTNPSSGNLSAVRIVYRQDQAPQGPSDGAVLADDIGPPGEQRSLVHTGALNGTTYHYP